MPEIDIRMFEVQLGAALLLQMKDSAGNTVSVLADAGINARNYPRDHVAQRLKPILSSQHIDLVIGTHYDQDHLAGLIDVADQFTIGEAILPPVRRPRHSSLIAPGAAALTAEDPDDAPNLPRLIDLSDEEFAGYIRELEDIAAEAERLVHTQFSFDEFPRIASDDELEHLESVIPTPEEEFDLTTPFVTLARPPRQLLLAQLTHIRASAKKGAIVAKWLQQLVSKLRAKNIRMRAIDIAAGTPEYFVWDKALSRFVACTSQAYSASSEPKFTLLGPSRQLIALHAKKLPIGAYFALIGRIPIKQVTPSNQLSYVMLFETTGQKILITGDAGCVDFWNKKSKAYHPLLISAMQDLHVVQVAHHAGNNHRFYDVLVQSGYPNTNVPNSYLLLSHAVSDKLRPTPAFGTFMSALTSVSKFKLLTTSQPDPAKIASFHGHYHPATQPPASTGDVRLVYDNAAWKVDRHLVKV